MIHILKSFAAKIWLTLILLIILGGIFMGTTRLLLPIAAEFRQEAEELASKALGQKVKIEHLKTSWRGYGPELILGNVQLTNLESGLPSLRIAKIHIGIGILDSLRNRAITPRQITFYQTRMLIKRRPDGAIILAGLEDMKESGGDGSTAFLLPFRISLRESEIYLDNRNVGAAPLRFTEVEFDITNGKNRHQIEASMRLPGETGGKIHLIADIRGEILQSDNWSGEVYLTGDQLSISASLKDRIPEGSAFLTGQTSMKLWSRWDHGQITSMEGQINFRDINLISEYQASNTSIKPLKIGKLGGIFNWQRSKTGWQLDVADMEFERNGLAWPKSSLSLVTNHDRRGNMQLRAGMEFARIKDILAIIGIFPLPSRQLADALNTTQPEADLHSLQLRFQETPEGPIWSGRGQLENITINTWKKIPGATDLSAKFWLDQNQGTIALEGEDFTTNFPHLFRDKIQLDKLSGRVHWNYNPEQGWTLETKRLIAINQDVKTETRLRLKIPKNPKQPLFLDLQTDFRDGNPSATPRYLPTTIMPDKVVAWLDTSIISGRVPDGSAIFRGPLNAFPFKKNTGLFEVLFNVDNIELNYDPDWPHIKKLSGKVRFHNNSLDIQASKGTLFNSNLSNLHGHIDNLKNGSPLKIKGTARGPLSDKLKILTQTPLADDFGAIASSLDAKGDADLALNLSLPLSSGNFRIKGKLGFKNSTLTLKKSKLSLSKIKGQLKFNEKGATAKGIKAKILGENIKVNITPQKRGGPTQITASGAISSTKLAKHFPNLGLNLLDGRSNWSMQFEIPSLLKNRGQMYTKITASSNLVGTAIKQPAPIGKSKKQKKQLRLTTTISKNPIKNLRISYGKTINSNLFISTNKRGAVSLKHGTITLGGGKAPAPQPGHLLLSGELKQLNLSPWLNNTQTKGKLSLPKIRGENLRFGKLKFGDTTLNNVNINFTENKQGINGRILSSLMDGKIQIPLPFKSKPITIDLDRLSLKPNPDKLSKTPKKDSTKAKKTDPRTLPGINLSSKKLVINGKDLGPFKMTARRIPEGLKLEQIKISSKRLNVSAHGLWTRKNNRTLSSIKLKGKTDSLGKLLTTLGFTTNLKKGPADIQADLAWSGNPSQFNNTDVGGHMRMHIGKGRFLDVDPGLGRVFGLLNISALQRRLSLDFSDTFKKGFSFDTVEGSFELDKGNAYTNDLRLESPSALIEITGRTGLVDQDFDQLVAVTPSISTTIPVVAALAGGPAVGAAVLLVQKLIGKQVDKVSTTKYSITGPWSKPNISKIN